MPSAKNQTASWPCTTEYEANILSWRDKHRIWIAHPHPMSSCQTCQSQLDKSAFVLVGFALPPPTIRSSCIREGAELNLALAAAAAAHPFGSPWGQHLRYLSHAHAV